jgi:nitrate reductase alpha subunit
MHPFIHPFTKAVSPVWESKSDWDIFKLLAKKFSELSVGHLGVEKDIVTVPLLHDTPGELSKTGEGKEWKKGEIDAIPGKTMPNIVVVERDYPNTYNKFTSLGPLLEKLGNGSKGMNWDTKHEVEFLKKLNRTHNEDSIRDGRPKIETDIEAIETILSLAPETNGEVAVKAWETLSKNTGIDHKHLALTREDEKIRFRDLRAQPRKIITSPTWSGVDSEEVSYTANYTNVHELIPWRTLTGRLTSYQDHPWMRAFGAALTHYKPPIDTKTIGNLMNEKDDGNPQLAINMITPHNKWTIHTTWSDNLTMLTLGRGGPVVWLSEDDAKKIGVIDNDWVEIYNKNGASIARVILSQRVPNNLLIMYHSAEKHVNMPGSKTTGNRGGIHNSLNKVELNPTHMIGGYAQLSWGFNYYGTLGTNRDEIVVIRKLDKVDWMDD